MSLVKKCFSLLSRTQTPLLTKTSWFQDNFQLQRAFFACHTKTYEHLLTEKRDKGVAIIKLNRPKALNALCNDLLDEIVCALKAFDSDEDVSVVILTGNGDKAFCAGADIKEMQSKIFVQTYKMDMFSQGDCFFRIRKPIIAAVNGFALGGGCELAMACDIILASDKAKFAQPEIKLGTICGMGGTQRLTHAIGKSRAMELCLTGDQFTAQQANDWGLVSRVIPHDKLMDEAITLAEKISSKSRIPVSITKQCINRVFETSLQEGVLFERRLFHATFGTKDQIEGMTAFVEKRDPKFTNQ